MSLMPLGLLSQGGSAGAGGNALTLISTQLLSGTSASVTFSSIPSTYKHLQVRIMARSDNATAPNIRLQFNSDTAANYAYHAVYGNGSSVASFGSSSATFTFIGESSSTAETTGIFYGTIADILDYANTNKNKTVRGLMGSAYALLRSGLWNNTAAISTMVLTPSSGNFVAGSRFSLYGVS